jgi:hypothetical protein
VEQAEVQLPVLAEQVELVLLVFNFVTLEVTLAFLVQIPVEACPKSIRMLANLAQTRVISSANAKLAKRLVQILIVAKLIVNQVLVIIIALPNKISFLALLVRGASTQDMALRGRDHP